MPEGKGADRRSRRARPVVFRFMIMGKKGPMLDDRHWTAVVTERKGSIRIISVRRPQTKTVYVRPRNEPGLDRGSKEQGAMRAEPGLARAGKRYTAAS